VPCTWCGRTRCSHCVQSTISGYVVWFVLAVFCLDASSLGYEMLMAPIVWLGMSVMNVEVGSK
jgi:hypothetical protein